MKLKTVFFILVFICLTISCVGQLNNPYYYWKIDSVDQIDFNSFNSFNDLELYITRKIDKRNLCNKRILSNVLLNDTATLEVMFFKCCIREYPIKTPKTRIVITETDFINEADYLKLIENTSNIVDSLHSNVSKSTMSCNFKIVWNRSYNSNDIIRFMTHLYEFYVERFNYKSGTDCYYNFPVIFFAIEDCEDVSEILLPKLNINRVGDSILIIK